MKTEGLKQALDKYRFDAAFGGARRDEEKSRAKERVFSFRDQLHRWDPKNQRPELWNLYNAKVHKGESIRVFPLSNWTELDVWQYIHLENIPIVPLYFAEERPVVERDGMLIMVDDDRLPLEPRREARDAAGPLPHARLLPAHGRRRVQRDDAARDHPGDAARRRRSERQGRVIDHDQAGSMEKKKKGRVLLSRMSHQSDLIATDIDAYLDAARAQGAAALPHLRQRRRRQEHAHRPAAVRTKMIYEDQLAAVKRRQRRRTARRAARSTSPCSPTA